MRVPEGYTFREYEELGSTNDECFDLATQGDDFIVIALRQTAGRGQRGRAFFSGVGGLYMSVSWRPPKSVLARTPELTHTTGLCVRAAIHELTGVWCEVKLPNDLKIKGKKVCGILTEARTGTSDVVVFGIGVNIENEIPADLGEIAANLRDMTGAKLDKYALAEGIVFRLIHALEEFTQQGVR